MTSWNSLAKIFIVAMLAMPVAACNKPKDPGYQGWVEADLIFVSPEESGRVTKLNVREGDEVKTGMEQVSQRRRQRRLATKQGRGCRPCGRRQCLCEQRGAAVAKAQRALPGRSGMREARHVVDPAIEDMRDVISVCSQADIRTLAEFTG